MQPLERKLLADADKGTPSGFGQWQIDALLKVGVKLAILYENRRLKEKDFEPPHDSVLRLGKAVVSKWDRLQGARDPRDPDHAKTLRLASSLREEVRRLSTPSSNMANSMSSMKPLRSDSYCT